MKVTKRMREFQRRIKEINNAKLEHYYNDETCPRCHGTIESSENYDRLACENFDTEECDWVVYP
jgi:hypothetical protein